MFKFKKISLTVIAILISACTAMFMNSVSADAAEYEAGDAVLQEQINNLKQDLADLTASVSENQTSLSELNIKISEAEDMIADLQNDSAKQTDLDDLRLLVDAANAALQSQINTMSNKVTELTEAVYKSNADFAALSTAIDEAQTAISALQNNTALKSEVTSLRVSTDAAIAELKQKVNALTDEVNTLTGKLNGAQDGIASNAADIAELNSALSAAGTAIEALQNNSALKSEVTSLRVSTDAAIAELKQKVNSLTNEVNTLTGKLNGAQDSIASNAADIADLNSALSAAGTAIEALQNNSALKSELATLRNVIDAADAELRQEINSLKSKIADLTADLADTNSSVEANSSTIAQLSSTLTAASTAIKALEENGVTSEELAELKNTTDAAILELNALYSALNKQLGETKASLSGEIDLLKEELEGAKTESRMLIIVLFSIVIILSVIFIIKSKKPSAPKRASVDVDSELCKAILPEGPSEDASVEIPTEGETSSDFNGVSAKDDTAEGNNTEQNEN